MIESKNISGIYAGVTFNDDTTAALGSYIEKNQISNSINPIDLHTTLISQDNITHNGILEQYSSILYEGTTIGLDIWETQINTKCLVLVFDCPELTLRHQLLIEKYNIVYKFSEFIPHITLSYNFTLDSVEHLSDFSDKIVMIEEFQKESDIWKSQ